MKEDNKCECEQHCGCVFTKEEIEKYSINNYGNLVDLTKEPSYSVPRGLTREERRKYIESVGRRRSYGFTKEKAESISKSTEEAYKAAMRVVRDKIRVDVKQPKIMFIQTPSRFEIITLTNSVTEGEKCE